MEENMAEENKFHIEVISPERIFYEDDVEMIEFNTTEGEMGVLPEHVPTTVVLAPGVLRFINGDEVKEAAVYEGFAEILKKKVTILAETAEWPEEIDVKRAEEAKIRAERRIHGSEGDINLTRAENALKRSLIRIELAQKVQR